jgi:hypothetical protein
MKKFVDRILARLTSLFRRPVATEVAVVEAAPVAPTKRNRSHYAEMREAEEGGAFHLRAAILDQLDDYFDLIGRMRVGDPAAYALYSKVGAHLLPDNSKSGISELPPHWRANGAPSFGAFIFSRSQKESDNILRMLYFQKLKCAPNTVQPIHKPGEVFEVTVYVDGETHKTRVALKYHVHVANGGGKVTLLKMRQKLFTRVWSTRRGHKGAVHIPKDVWDYPHWLTALFHDTRKTNKAATVEEFACQHLYFAAQFHANGNSDIQVRVAHPKKPITAAFAIATKRTAYFFKDRDAGYNENGNKRKIFHVVRPHMRGDKAIKMHFRGEREFHWNGYGVTITVPGLTNPDLYGFKAAADHFDDGDAIPPGMLTMGQAGKQLADSQHA